MSSLKTSDWVGPDPGVESWTRAVDEGTNPPQTQLKMFARLLRTTRTPLQMVARRAKSTKAIDDPTHMHGADNASFQFEIGAGLVWAAIFAGAWAYNAYSERSAIDTYRQKVKEAKSGKQ